MWRVVYSSQRHAHDTDPCIYHCLVAIFHVGAVPSALPVSSYVNVLCWITRILRSSLHDIPEFQSDSFWGVCLMNILSTWSPWRHSPYTNTALTAQRAPPTTHLRYPFFTPHLRTTTPDYALVCTPDYAPQHHFTLDSPFSLVLYFQGTPYPMSLSTSSSSSFLAWLSIPNSHMSPKPCFPAYRNGFVTKHPTHTY